MKKHFKSIIQLILVFSLLAAFCAHSYAVSSFTTKSQFTGKTYTHYGDYSNMQVKDMIDVSEHNGIINWYKVKAVGIDDAIIRVGYRGYGSAGNMVADKYYIDNIEGAMEAGVNVGLYFYSQSLNTSEASAEAEYLLRCLNKVSRYNITLPVFFDYEFAEVSDGRLDAAWSSGRINKAKMTQNAIAFCETIREAGFVPGIYGSAGFFTYQYNADEFIDRGYKIWNAYYTQDSTRGSYWPNQNRIYEYWQYGGDNVQGCCGAPSNAWLKVSYGGDTGYVSGQYVEFAGASTGITITDLNMRSGASTSYGILRKIPEGARITIHSYPTNTNTDLNFYYTNGELTQPEFSLYPESTEVKVAWSAVPGADFYRVYLYISNGHYERLGQTTKTYFYDTGLKSNTNYTYLVRAFHNNGTGSDYEISDNQTVRTSPAKPSFKLSSNQKEITVSWSNVSGAYFYRVYRYIGNGHYERMAQTTDTSWTDTEGLEQGVTYTYLVRAFNDDYDGSSYTVDDNKGMELVPNQPTGLQLTDASLNTLSVKWNSVKGAAFYRVYVYVGNGSYERMGQVKTNSFTITDLKQSQRYEVLVRAFSANVAGSDYKVSDNVECYTLSPTPTLKFTRYSYSINIRWDAKPGTQFYRVYRYIGGGSYERLAQTTDTSWQEDGLRGNTKYTYLVRAFTTSSTGSPFSVDDNQSVYTLLRKPQFTLTALDEHNIRIQWSEISGADFYRVYTYDAKDGYERVAQTRGLSFTFDEAQPDTEYTFLVRAFDDDLLDGSSYSKANHESIKTPPAGTTLEKMKAAVQNSSVTLRKAYSDDVGEITLSWDAVENLSFTGYQIQYSSYDAFDYFQVQGVDKEDTTYTLDLVPGVCYKLRVRTYMSVDGGKVYGKWSGIKTLYTTPRVGANPDVQYLLDVKVRVSAPGATGCVRLNNALDNILDEINCGSDSDYGTYEKVRRVYRYIATEQFKEDGTLGAKGSTDYDTYEEYSVLRMLENKGQTGSCLEYNCLFHYLCLRMGLKNTYMVEGTVSSSGGGRTNHWWVMMKIAGNNYYYDPRMQRYMNDNTAFQFFNLPMNGDNPYSDYYRFYDAQEELVL